MSELVLSDLALDAGLWVARTESVARVGVIASLLERADGHAAVGDHSP